VRVEEVCWNDDDGGDDDDEEEWCKGMSLI
jgi:hypothetical protein